MITQTQETQAPEANPVQAKTAPKTRAKSKQKPKQEAPQESKQDSKPEAKEPQKYKWVGHKSFKEPKEGTQKAYYVKAARELKTFTLAELGAKALSEGLTFAKGGDPKKNLGYYSSILQSRDLVIERVK